MTVFIRQAVVVSPSSPFHLQAVDIIIENGIFTDINFRLERPQHARVIDIKGLHISIGWVDIMADFGEPGFEYRETLLSGSMAAAAGGFTDVLISPETKPVISGRSMVAFIKDKASITRLHPVGTISKDGLGKELAEMYDMAESGAVAFSDGFKPIQHPGVMVKALQYVLPINANIIQIPNDRSIGTEGLMNEGITSTQLGLPGIPALAEELMIARDIELVKYTKSRLHIAGISTQKGMEMIKQAKKEGYQITCSVTPYHLHFCDDDLVHYDTNLKVFPPLRTKQDREALIEGVKQGWIDAITSLHRPAHKDEKECEFEYAQFGMAGIQTAFSATFNLIGDINTIVQRFTAARNIFNLPPEEIGIGRQACLTLFNPNENFIFTNKQGYSLSHNNAFLEKPLRGRVLGTIIQNKIYLNQ